MGKSKKSLVKIVNEQVILDLAPEIKFTLSPEGAKQLGEELMRAGIQIRADRKLRKWIAKKL